MIPPSDFAVPSAGASGTEVLSAATEVNSGSLDLAVGATTEGALQAPANSRMGMTNLKQRMGPPGRGKGKGGYTKMKPSRVHLQHILSTK
jgi:hypothetical protein